MKIKRSKVTRKDGSSCTFLGFIIQWPWELVLIYGNHWDKIIFREHPEGHAPFYMTPRGKESKL